jgi:hypothetical protein
MKVRVVRSGGFAGVRQLLGEHDSELGSDSIATQLRERIDALARAIDLKSPTVGADLIQYEVTLEESGVTRTLSLADEGDPNDPAMKQVLAIVDLLQAPSPVR